MEKNIINNFISQVKQEALNVSWPSKKEVITTSLVVLLMVSVFACFFLLIDVIVHKVIQLLLN